MRALIHFRSHILEWTQSEVGLHPLRNQGTEVQWVRPYIIGDDPRHIAWKKWAGTRDLYTKEYTLGVHPRIVVLPLLDEKTLDYATREIPESKWSFLTTLLASITESARALRFDMSSITVQELQEKHFTHTLILIVTDIENASRYREFLPFGSQNDVIFLELAHPIELYPERWTLFESRHIQSEYRIALDRERTERADDLLKHRITPLFAETNTSPVTFLNHFFKYRYVR